MSARETNQEELFSWGLYGMLIRKKRVDLGYRKAKDFSQSIWLRTRTKITRDMLYKIEQGRQIPDAQQFMALNIALYGNPYPLEIIELCLSRAIKDIIAHYADESEYSECNPYVPSEWAYANWEEVNNMLRSIGENPTNESFDANSTAEISGEPRSLFVDHNEGLF